jgi:ariadne-1
MSSEDEYNYSSDSDDNEYNYSSDSDDNMDDDSPSLPTSSPILKPYVSTLDVDKIVRDSKLNLSKSKSMSNSRAGRDFLCLSPIEEKKMVHDIINEVVDLLCVTRDKAAVILLSQNWSKEKVVELYLHDPYACVRECGCNITDVGILDPKKMNSDIYDPVTMDSLTYKDTLSLGCLYDVNKEDEHRYGLDSWNTYLECELSKGSECIFSKCPEDKCFNFVAPSAWRMLVSPESLSRYDQFFFNSFVELRRDTKWCPGKGCEMAIQSLNETSAKLNEVLCDGCYTSFCFNCSNETHRPASCSTIQLWDEKNKNESETANWILAHTKKCGSCGTRIEKNSGCNHMTCRVCKYQFCWLCDGDWKNHGNTSGGYYSCNRFKDGVEVDKDGSSESANAKIELNRYLHYYKRYHEHEVSFKFAENKREEVLEKMNEIRENSNGEGLSWADASFMENAVDQLVECRRVLKFTYVYSYFLKPSPFKELFEYSQSDLERNTEKLTEMTETDADLIDRMDIVNFTRVIVKSLKSLLDEIDRDSSGEGGSFSDVSKESIEDIRLYG